ncbi:MAG: GDSL-type esterase/lipase family protein [Saprospiraceae bacterium]
MTYKIRFYLALAIIALGLLAASVAVQKLGGWRYTAHRLHTIEAWPTYTQRLSQLELLPIDTGAVVFLGDSHVAFGEWHEWLPNISVANRGIPGEGIEGLCAFAKTLDLSAASVIFVQIGTNDLLFHEPEKVISFYKGMVAQMDQLDAQVVYCTLPGVNNEVRWTGIEPDDIDLVNALILSLKEKGQPVIDLAAALGTHSGVLPKGLTDDGVHLRGEGYKVWNQEFDHYLNRVVMH